MSTHNMHTFLPIKSFPLHLNVSETSPHSGKTSLVLRRCANAHTGCIYSVKQKEMTCTQESQGQRGRGAEQTEPDKTPEPLGVDGGPGLLTLLLPVYGCVGVLDS